MQRHRLGVADQFFPPEFAALECFGIVWVGKQRAHGRIFSSGELGEEFRTAFAHQFRQPRLVVREEDEGARRGKLLSLKQQRSSRSQQKQGGHRPVPAWTGQLVDPLATRGIGNLIVVLNEGCERGRRQTQRWFASRLPLMRAVLPLV